MSIVFRIVGKNLIKEAMEELGYTSYLASRLMHVPALFPLLEGVLVADGTEQTVCEYSELAVVHGYIDLQNMEAGDEVVIRAYVRFKPGGAYKKYAEDTYSGSQDLPALYVLPRLTVYGIKVTLQQTAGTYKSFDYVFVKEG